MTVYVFDDRPCKLGEGPFWHPERDLLFWFDIAVVGIAQGQAEHRVVP